MKTKQKIQEFFKRILCIAMLIILFSSNLKVNAAVSVEEAGAAIASFAIDFYNKYGERVHYKIDYDLRGQAYREETVGSMAAYYMDCVGWVSYAIHHATGLDNAGARAGTGSFVAPTRYGPPGSDFVDVTGQELQPGDIMANSHHVMIYVGNNMMVHCSADLQYMSLDDYGNGNAPGSNYESASYGPGRFGVYDRAYRLSESAAAKINESDLAPIISGLDKSKKKKDYSYKGLPSKGEYTGSQGTLSLLKSIINVLSQIADYLIGLMTLGIKIELIGWTTVVENVITDAINEITGTELEPSADSALEEEEASNSAEDTTEQTGEETDEEDTREDLYTPDATETVTGSYTNKNDRITVEKIIYNKVPILDVNIFNTEEAGGQKLVEGGTLYTIKNSIAKWYYVFRNVAIIGLLIVLLYIGIRMALSTAAAEKAVYKRFLKDWVVSFIIVFCIHYIMIFILNINEYLVNLMVNSEPNREHFLYETVRTKAYELKFTSGLAGTVMYMVLVYLMIKYLFIYFKRYLTINILAIIAPIIGISYAIDKLKDGKSQSFKAWLQDFTFTTLLQSVHAILYTMFIPIALTASEENIAGIIFAFMLLNFMAKADKIVAKMFGMTGGRSLSNILKGQNPLVALAALKGVGKVYKTGIKYTGKAVKGVGTTIGQIGGIVLPQETRYRFNTWYNNTADSILGEHHFLNQRRTNNIQTVSGIDDKIRTMKKLYRKEAIRQITGPVKFAKDGVKFAAKTMVAIPMLVVEPLAGIKNMLAIRGYKKVFDSETEKMKLRTPKSERGLNHIIVHRTKNQIGRSIDSNGERTTTSGKIDGQAVTGNRSKKQKTTGPRAALAAKKKSVQTMQARFEKSIAMLEEAKTLEESIISKYSGIRESVNDRLNTAGVKSSAAAKMPTVLLDKLNKQYDQMIEEIFKEVSDGDVEGTVEEYLKKKKNGRIEEKDVDELVKLLQERLNKDKDSNIEISEQDAMKNIENVIQTDINARLVKGIDAELKKNNITWEDIDKGKQDDIARDMERALEKTDDIDTLMDALDKSLLDHKVTTRLSETVKKDIIKNLSRRMEREKGKTYSPKEMVGILKKGLKKKGSIKKEPVPSEFSDIAQDMENLSELNDKYEKEFGQKIFSKEEIIQAMKKTKDSKEFDLYNSIMNGEQ